MTSATSTSEPMLDWLRQLPDIRHELRHEQSVGRLFSRAAAIACARCGFDRAVILSVAGRCLEAGTTDPLDGAESDLLRRRVLREPVELPPDSVEAKLVRQPKAGARRGGATTVQSVLGLKQHAFGVIAPEGTVLALLVVDRETNEVTAADLARLGSLATLVELVLERIVIRSRAAELDAELRQFAGALHAMVQEVLRSPIELPRDQGRGPSFPRARAAAPIWGGTLREGLTDREMQVALLLTKGLSNRAIGEELILSAETVKATVPRILRKLGAVNRAEAAAIIVRLAQP